MKHPLLINADEDELFLKMMQFKDDKEEQEDFLKNKSESYKGLKFLITKLDEEVYAQVVGRYNFLTARAKTYEDLIKSMEKKIDEFWERRYPK